MHPSEDLVAIVDLGLYGRALSIGSRLVGDVLQWFDGRELHLVRGRVVPESVRRRSFGFARVGDGQVLKFAELSGKVFEDEFRKGYPDAPRQASGAEIRAWLLANHGLWKPPMNADEHR